MPASKSTRDCRSVTRRGRVPDRTSHARQVVNALDRVRRGRPGRPIQPAADLTDPGADCGRESDRVAAKRAQDRAGAAGRHSPRGRPRDVLRRRRTVVRARPMLLRLGITAPSAGRCAMNGQGRLLCRGIRSPLDRELVRVPRDVLRFPSEHLPVGDPGVLRVLLLRRPVGRDRTRSRPTGHARVGPRGVSEAVDFTTADAPLARCSSSA